MRLAKRGNSGNALKNCEDCEIKFRESCCSKQLCLNALINKLAAYEDAEEQGRLVILPCKVGDTVFSAFEDEDVFCGKVYAISTCDGTNWFSVRYDSGLRYDHTWDCFGKTVFLTHAEAEAALKGGQNDGH